MQGSLEEVTVCWANWQKSVRTLKMFPGSKECQALAMFDQKELVISQAFYWAERRP